MIVGLSLVLSGVGLSVMSSALSCWSGSAASVFGSWMTPLFDTVTSSPLCLTVQAYDVTDRTSYGPVIL